MSKHLNFTSVTDPVRVTQHEITGMIGTDPVVIRRELEGWHVNITVRIDGILWHNSEATTVDRLEFIRLMERATDAEWERTSKKNQRVFDLAAKVGLRS